MSQVWCGLYELFISDVEEMVGKENVKYLKKRCEKSEECSKCVVKKVMENKNNDI